VWSIAQNGHVREGSLFAKPRSCLRSLRRLRFVSYRFRLCELDRSVSDVDPVWVIHGSCWFRSSENKTRASREEVLASDLTFLCAYRILCLLFARISFLSSKRCYGYCVAHPNDNRCSWLSYFALGTSHRKGSACSVRLFIFIPGWRPTNLLADYDRIC
jgi:hypothetical protein